MNVNEAGRKLDELAAFLQQLTEPSQVAETSPDLASLHQMIGHVCAVADHLPSVLEQLATRTHQINLDASKADPAGDPDMQGEQYALSVDIQLHLGIAADHALFADKRLKKASTAAMKAIGFAAAVKNRP